MIKQIVFSVLLSTFLFSCGSKSGNTETKKDKQGKAAACRYDNDVSDLGIGLVLAPANPDVFNDEALAEKYDGQVCPKFFKPDYNIIHFVCLEKTDKYYKVLVSRDEVKYLPVEKDYEFNTWAEYITGSFGVRRMIDEAGKIMYDQPLRKAPDGGAGELKIPVDDEMFCAMEIQGDWIKVKYDCFYNNDDNPHEGEPCDDYISECKDPLTGWLQWRKGNMMLIDVMLIP